MPALVRVFDEAAKPDQKSRSAQGDDNLSNPLAEGAREAPAMRSRRRPVLPVAVPIDDIAVQRANDENVALVGDIEIRTSSQAVGHVFRAEALEIPGRLALPVLGTHQHRRIGQLVGYYPEMQPGIAVEAVLTPAAQLARAALVSAHVEGVLVVMNLRPSSKCKADHMSYVAQTYIRLGAEVSGRSVGKQVMGEQQGDEEGEPSGHLAKRSGQSHFRYRF